MRPTDDIRRFIDRAAARTNPATDEMVLGAVLKAQENAIHKAPAAVGPGLRSIIMRSPITKAAIAAAFVLAALLFIGLWDRSVPTAYALEQTLEANRNVRTLHIRNFTIGHEEPREGWIESDEEGQVRSVRAHMPAWASPVDGARVLVWQDDKVQMWLKQRNSLAITRADSVLRDQLNAMLQKLDPRLVLAHIAELKQQGKVEMAVAEPSDGTKLITMTVTYLADSDKPGHRQVLSIDPATKLVSTIELYQLQEGAYRHEARVELQEYNQPLDPKIFDLASEAPADVNRLDLASTNLGLAQETLSDEKVAAAVVCQFFESLIARDYDAAGRLFPFGADSLRQQFDSTKVLRIVSLGPAVPNPGSDRKVTVPCTFEIEENGKRQLVTLKGITVQPLDAQPDRWMIQRLDD